MQVIQGALLQDIKQNMSSENPKLNVVDRHAAATQAHSVLATFD